MPSQSSILAQISVELWQRCRELGYTTKVTCSYHSLSRYVKAKGAFTIRLSDHAHDDDTWWDYQVVVGPKDTLAAKMKEAMDLLHRIHGPATAAA